MQSYNAHSQYFETLCRKTKIFSHGRIDAERGDERKTFFRMNDADEALDGQVTGMHFPCLIHNEYGVKGITKGDAERLSVGNTFWVLAKPEDSSASAIEAAYNQAELALQKIIRKMLQEYEETESCGPYQNLDISMFSWHAIQGAELGGLYGFELTIREEQKATQYTTYDETDYYP